MIKTVDVHKIDNGYIIRWCRLYVSDEDKLKQFGVALDTKVDGTEVFTSRKAMLKRVNELL